MTSIVTIKTKERSSSYGIKIDAGLLSSAGEWAKECLSNDRARTVIISNRKIYGLYGDTVYRSLSAAGFSPSVHLIGDGERFKNLRTLEKALHFLSNSGIKRTDSLIALGGGVVGDLTGFAAAIYLRGIEFLQIPTTLLSMIDSSVGGKTGVNTSFGKNLVGAFYHPRGVLIDTETLATLPQREITAGFCEAIKQGAISGRRLFDQTFDFLSAIDAGGKRKIISDLELKTRLAAMLAAQVSFKAEIVAGDEKESAVKADGRSRKILNFGHTFGHALEKVTKYRYLRHGEAVGYGILFAAHLSKYLGLLRADYVNLLNDVVHRAGKLPPISNIDPREIFATFKFDKKMVNDSLQWILLESIGKPVIFPHERIPQSALINAFKASSHS